MRFLAASVLPVAAAMAQDRFAFEAAVAWEAVGIEVPRVSSRSDFVRHDEGLVAPWRVPAFRHGGDDDPVGRGATEPTGSWRSLHDPTLDTRSLWGESNRDGDAGGASRARVIGGDYMDLHRPRNSCGTGDEPFTFGFDNTDTGAGSLDCGLLPSYVLAVGLDGKDRQAGSIAVHAEAHLGIYTELGIEPSFSLARLGGLDVTFAVPLTMGFCLKNYYVDVDGRGDLFGYLELGAVASTPLPFLPTRTGSWHVDLGLHWLLSGDSNEQRQAGEHTDMIVSIALGTTF
jgi:hypothetical protein